MSPTPCRDQSSAIAEREFRLSRRLPVARIGLFSGMISALILWIVAFIRGWSEGDITNGVYAVILLSPLTVGVSFTSSLIMLSAIKVTNSQLIQVVSHSVGTFTLAGVVLFVMSPSPRMASVMSVAAIVAVICTGVWQFVATRYRRVLSRA